VLLALTNLNADDDGYGNKCIDNARSWVAKHA
jgi:hypothetical protein